MGENLQEKMKRLRWAVADAVMPVNKCDWRKKCETPLDFILKEVADENLKVFMLWHWKWNCTFCSSLTACLGGGWSEKGNLFLVSLAEEYLAKAKMKENKGMSICEFMWEKVKERESKESGR